MLSELAYLSDEKINALVIMALGFSIEGKLKCYHDYETGCPIISSDQIGKEELRYVFLEENNCKCEYLNEIENIDIPKHNNHFVSCFSPVGDFLTNYNEAMPLIVQEGISLVFDENLMIWKAMKKDIINYSNSFLKAGLLTLIESKLGNSINLDF